MPTSTKQIHQNLKPFVFHGVVIDDSSPDITNAKGDCPFCGREGKLGIVTATSQWRCVVCNESGNTTTFLRKLWEVSEQHEDEYEGKTLEELYRGLADHRGLLEVQTLKEWGVRRSITNDDWIVPAFNHAGNLTQLYRYVKRGNKSILYATPECHAGLFGADKFTNSKKTTYICEGPWDAMALYETMKKSKQSSGNGGKDSEGLTVTGAIGMSLWASCNILAVPGCSTFSDAWNPMFAGQDVVLMYDNDHPKEHAGRTTQAAYDGAKRAIEIMNGADKPPQSMKILQWGTLNNPQDEKGYTASLGHGYDVRDFLSKGESNNKSGSTSSSPPIRTRIQRLSELLKMIRPFPSNWVEGRSKSAVKSGSGEIESVKCKSWNDLHKTWLKAMKWTEGLDRALSIMLACILSTKRVGDQLWVKIVGPPSCGKSSLADALVIARNYVVSVSTFRGFVSGYQSDREGTEDNSLISRVRDKTMITKDGDTLMKSPDVERILSEARNVYDRNISTSYRNKRSEDYQQLDITWILCGTPQLKALDKSELGQRFLDCVIMEDIDPDLEDDVVWRIVNRATREIATGTNCKADSRTSGEMLLAMQMTGGYVNWLREHGEELLGDAENMMGESILRRIARLGIFTAYMRARPSITGDESAANREFGGRLASQLTRLAACLCVVLNRKTVDDEVMRRVTQTALDTSRGHTLEIVKWLYKHGQEGLEANSLAVYTNHTPAEERKLLRFLRKIEAVETFSPQEIDIGVRKIKRMSSNPRWRLTPRLQSLYESVYDVKNNIEG